MTDHTGRALQYSYDEYGDLISSANANSDTRTYKYQPAQREADKHLNNAGDYINDLKTLTVEKFQIVYA